MAQLAEMTPSNLSWPLQLANRVIDIRPLVRLTAQHVGSGPNRLRMVKLSHQLGEAAYRRPR
jgi:hypothetical protein